MAARATCGSIPRRTRYLDKAMKPDVPRSQFDALGLAAIEYAPAHGYEIIRRIRLRSADVFSLPQGTVYPALHRLERDGLVKGRWEKEGGRKRRTYRVTR